jgi:hypothetical protein
MGQRGFKSVGHASSALKKPFPLEGGRVGLGVYLLDPKDLTRIGAEPNAARPGRAYETPPSPALPPSRGKGVEASSAGWGSLPRRSLD